MMTNEIVLEKLDQNEALRYLGYGGNAPDTKVQDLLDECEELLHSIAKPRFVYKVFDIDLVQDGVAVLNTNLVMPGNSIKEHLNGCEKAVLMGVTISMDVDRLLRKTQVNDMTRAVIIDSLASVAVEQVCNKIEEFIKNDLAEYNQTWRFGVGYGDLPLNIQGDFLDVINAPKQIGLSASKTNMLIPTKSVTAIIGLSKKEIVKIKRGCQTCNMKDSCTYRKKGGHCNV